MFKEIVLGLSLSVLFMAPLQASAMDLIEDYQPSAKAPVVLEQSNKEVKASRSYKEQAYEIVDGYGLTNLAKGAGNLVIGGGRVVKDAGHVAIAAGETFAAAGHVALSPFNWAYNGRDAASYNLQSAKDYGYAAYDNVKTAVSDMPATYENAKIGLVELFTGAKKLLTPVYNGAVAAINSKPVQSAWEGVKSWFASKASNLITPSFDNVDFS